MLKSILLFYFTLLFIYFILLFYLQFNILGIDLDLGDEF